MKYTREDVIITREQAEMAGLKKGMACYLSNFPSNCVASANRGLGGFIEADTLEDIDWDRESPFKDSSHGLWWDCVIIKKKPEKKLVPFDFSLEEDRKALMGKVIRKEIKSPYCVWETMVTAFNVHGYHEDWHVVVDNGLMQVSAEELFEDWTFADTGEPIGKEVES